MPVLVALLAVALGLARLLARSTGDNMRRFLETWFTRLLVLAAGLAVVLIGIPALVELLHSISATRSSTGAPAPGSGIGGAAGIVGLAGGVLAALRQEVVASKETIGVWSRLSAKCRLGLAYLAGAVAGPLLLLAVVVFTASAALGGSAEGIDPGTVALGLGAFGLSAALYALTDITSLSLHPFYKRRLCTAFALKRVRASQLDDGERDRLQAAAPGPDDDDVGIGIERDFDQLVTLSKTALGEDGTWPTLLVCAAANISDPGRDAAGSQGHELHVQRPDDRRPARGRGEDARPTRRPSAASASWWADTVPVPATSRCRPRSRSRARRSLRRWARRTVPR